MAAPPPPAQYHLEVGENETKFLHHHWITREDFITWCSETLRGDLSTHLARTNAWAALQGSRYKMRLNRQPPAGTILLDLQDPPFEDAYIRFTAQFQSSHTTNSQAQTGGAQLSDQAKLGMTYALADWLRAADRRTFWWTPASLAVEFDWH